MIEFATPRDAHAFWVQSARQWIRIARMCREAGDRDMACVYLNLSAFSRRQAAR